MKLWHLTLAARTRHSLFPDEALRLEALRRLVRICGPELVLFALVDDHLHWIVLCDERRRGYIARSVSYSIQALCKVDTKPVHAEVVHGRNHLVSLRGYLLRQPAKHGLAEHPALWTGGAFPDLVGARWQPGLRLRLGDVLPRCVPRDLFEDVGLPGAVLEPVANDELRAAGPRVIARSAAAACGAPRELSGLNKPVVMARRVTCWMGKNAGMPTRELAWALGIHPGAARKLTGVAAPPEALRATRVRLALEWHVARASARQHTQVPQLQRR
jgi:REP element-mobilizing transposase RayT